MIDLVFERAEAWKAPSISEFECARMRDCAVSLVDGEAQKRVKDAPSEERTKWTRRGG